MMHDFFLDEVEDIVFDALNDKQPSISAVS